MWGVNRPARDSLAHDVPRKRCYIDANIAAQGSQVGTDQKNDFALPTVQPGTNDSVPCGDGRLGCPVAERRNNAVAMLWISKKLPRLRSADGRGRPFPHKHTRSSYFTSTVAPASVNFFLM